MTAKEYLSQAYYIQKMIDAKCEQLEMHRRNLNESDLFYYSKEYERTDRASKVELTQSNADVGRRNQRGIGKVMQLNPI